MRGLPVEEVTKEMEVNAAPITEVRAAAQSTTPKIRTPISPAAARKASAAMLSPASATPLATTPKIARNSRTRMTHVTRMPSTDVRVISRTLSTPVTPESIMRWAPEYVMYPPTVPPMSVVMTRKSTSSGITVFLSASPTGGAATMATYSIMRIMTAPSATTIRSRARPARLDRKTRMAITAEMAPPSLGSMPSMALSPSPVPAMLPMLNTAPPRKTSAARTYPAPGSTWLASSWARMPETPMTRHTFSCTAMSTRMDTRIAKANAAPSCTVNTVVWVMNPGPIALVAMRNMAPSRALR